LKGTILFTKGNNYKNYKITPGIIFKAVWCFSFLVAILFFVLTYAVHKNFESNIKSDITKLDSTIKKLNSKIFQAQKIYDKIYTKSFESKNAFDIISAVNPNITEQSISKWVEIIFFNSDVLEKHLNKYSTKKLQGKRGLNSLSIGASLILAVGAVESDFYLKRRSYKGAAGGMQIAYSLAKELDIKNRYDPQENIKGGIKHLINLLNKFEDKPDQLELTLASYNAGYYRVIDEWIPTWGDRWEDIRNGLYLDNMSFSETRRYVRIIKKLTTLFTNGTWAEQEDEFWYRYKWETPKIVD